MVAAYAAGCKPSGGEDWSGVPTAAERKHEISAQKGAGEIQTDFYRTNVEKRSKKIKTIK